MLCLQGGRSGPSEHPQSELHQPAALQPAVMLLPDCQNSNCLALQLWQQCCCCQCLEYTCFAVAFAPGLVSHVRGRISDVKIEQR